jgi:hypothetical protein
MVTEGEASVHFVLARGDFRDRLRPGIDFIVCDAGGSTVDTTLYTVVAAKPSLDLKEKRASDCVQAGAIFVDQTARNYFRGLFSSTSHQGRDLDELVQEAVESFETEAKRSFEGSHQTEMFIKVGGPRFTERSIGVRRGILELSGNHVESFFAPWVEQILKSVENQMRGHSAQHILLVGGFGDSPYLRSRFRQHPVFSGVEICLTNDLTAKAVAEGAALWHMQRSVTARAARFAYGVCQRDVYDPSNPHHRTRSVEHLTQGDRIANVWGVICPKDTVVKNNQPRRRKYRRTYYEANPDLTTFSDKIYVLTADTAPYFMRDERGKLASEFSLACTVTADLSSARNGLRKERSERGTWWTLDFEIGILFGATELAAQLIWKDSDGKERRSVATVIPKRFT